MDSLKLEFMRLDNSTYYTCKHKEELLQIAIDWIVYEKLPENITNE
jgi:hypothetical protein